MEINKQEAINLNYTSPSNIKARSFSTPVINDWNALSNEVVTAANINQFKSRLEVFWSTKAFKYDPTGFWIGEGPIMKPL